MAAVHRAEDLPRSPVPVVAFVGRSNVGKSSLLNRLLGAAAARTGKTPGKTRGIYFYDTQEGHYFADLPGTGFARVSKADREGWARLAQKLFSSGGVVLAVQLIDPRVPKAQADLALRDYLDAHGAPALCVATKWDRLSAAERARARKELGKEHWEVLPVSAKTGEGIEVLRREIRRRLKLSGDLAVPRTPGENERKADG